MAVSKSPKGAPKPVNEDDPKLKIAAQIEAHFKANPTAAFMLGEPMSLTVVKADSTFSKRPMIGGESFTPTGCYVGKRESLIFRFKPNQASDFLVAEMSQMEAVKAFGGSFPLFLNTATGTSEKTTDMIEAASKAERDLAEKSKNEGKYNQYADIGYGSW